MLSGRFAPSPTGPLHMGSLITALASYLDIKSKGGSWHIRLDDIDRPREAPNARQHILASLNAHGLYSDSPIRYQSQYSERCDASIQHLQDQLFYCRCTRAQLKGLSTYPGTCRDAGNDSRDAALRLRIDTETPLKVEDAYLPPASLIPSKDVGDVIVRRRDQLWAYNFATAVDDGMDFTHVLRGQDLSATTAVQMIIMQLLDLDIPRYAHIPLLRFENGQKLSKQTHAPALDDKSATDNLTAAYYYLGCQPPREPNWSVAQWLSWGLSIWPQHQMPETLPIYQSKPVLT